MKMRPALWLWSCRLVPFEDHPLWVIIKQTIFRKGIQSESMLPFIRGQQKLNYNIRNLFVLNERKSAWNVWTQWHRRTNPSFLYEILVSGRMVLRNNFNVWSRTWVMECWIFSTDASPIFWTLYRQCLRTSITRQNNFLWRKILDKKISPHHKQSLLTLH